MAHCTSLIDILCAVSSAQLRDKKSNNPMFSAASQSNVRVPDGCVHSKMSAVVWDMRGGDKRLSFQKVYRRTISHNRRRCEQVRCCREH